jgi:hypothetical protein
MYYYRHDLALIHDRGHGQHADRCAPGIVELLSPVRGGVVLDGYEIARMARAKASPRSR